jgi:hypothetical protein
MTRELPTLLVSQLYYPPFFETRVTESLAQMGRTSDPISLLFEVGHD